MISIIIPYHEIPETAFFLKRAIDSIMMQTYTDYEIVLTKKGTMPVNTNEAIKRARGDMIKVLCMDDYFSHKNALKEIVEAFKGTWLVCGTDNNPYPYYTDDIYVGMNKLGGLSSLTFSNLSPLLFDEDLHWLIDCDYYKRLFDRYGEPVILDGVHVNIGTGTHQMTNVLSEEQKKLEEDYMRKKYEKS